MNNKYQVVVSFGYQESDGFVYHSVDLTDSKKRLDADSTGTRLAEMLGTTTDDEQFNWNAMMATIPDSVVERIKRDGVEERMRQSINAAVDSSKAGKYVVCLIGTYQSEDITCEDVNSAVERLRQAYEETLANANTDDHWYAPDKQEFQVTGEAFFQYGIVRKVNCFTGAPGMIYDIKQAAEDAATYANAYEYELRDMQGVYDMTQRIIRLCDQLNEEISHPAKNDLPYRDILVNLKNRVKSDSALKDNQASKASYLIRLLQDVLDPGGAGTESEA